MENNSLYYCSVNRFLTIGLILISLPCRAISKNWDEYSNKEREDAIVEAAYEQGHYSRYRKDCSGFVEAVLDRTGHDLPGFSRSYDIRANGVRQIYEYIKRSGTISSKKIPNPGDLVFFSNTYDLNRDRKLSDPLTHIGIVTNVDRDGTVSFLHIIHKKVKTDFMNLYKPNVYEENGKILNSYLRRVQKNSSQSVLTAQLFDFFGSLNP